MGVCGLMEQESGVFGGERDYYYPREGGKIPLSK